MSASMAIYRIIDLIMLLMLVKVFLSWIPNINWYNEPFNTLRRFTDIFFEPFRRIIPPVGMLDLSPVVAFLVLGIVQQVLFRLLVSWGY